MVFLWVALYGLTYTVSEKLSQSIQAFVMMLYIVLLILWIYRTGQLHNVGLCAVTHFSPKECLFFLPLVLLPLFNLLTAREYQIDFPTVVLMLGVSAAEEIFFRGFMLRFLSKRSRLSGILITSAVFALFHCVNLVQRADFTYTLMQVLCAFVVGICYCAIAMKSSSLLPCIASHFLTNVTGIGHPVLAGFGWEMVGLWICMAAYACYGIWLCRKIR